MTDDQKVSAHFLRRELACPATGSADLHPGFLDRLEMLRLIWGRPMVVTSGARSPEYNRRVGGAPASLHLTRNPRFGSACMAVDIAMADGASRGQFVALAWSHDWSVGVGKSFVHIDARGPLLGEPVVMWGYGA